MKIVKSYLNASGYKIDGNKLELQLETHPDYPSIKSITDTLDYFLIENLVANVPKNSLDELPKTFIGLIKEEGLHNVVLVEQTKYGVLLIDSNFNKKKLSFDSFIEQWEGIILAIEKNVSGIGVLPKVNSILILPLLLLGTLLFSLFFVNKMEILVYYLFSFIGLIISCFIVQEKWGLVNETVQKVCKSISSRGSCSEVINNEGFNLFNFITLSDACVAYFASSLLSFILFGYDESVLVVVSMSSTPVVLYSVYYQLKVLKKWCALCLGVSIVLSIQILILLLSFDSFEFKKYHLIKYIIVGLSVLFSWKTFDQLWVKKIKFLKNEKEFLKFKRDFGIFESLLKKNPIGNAVFLIEEEELISFGAKEPLVVINAVTNPLCKYCWESFQVYYDILSTKKDVQINFIFSVPNDIKSLEMQISLSILNLYFGCRREIALEAMKDWYNSRDIYAWKEKYTLETNLHSKNFSILKNHYKWLESNNVSNLPVTIIDGFYFPKSYQIEDLKMVIDEIILSKMNL